MFYFRCNDCDNATCYRIINAGCCKEKNGFYKSDDCFKPKCEYYVDDVSIWKKITKKTFLKETK